MLQVRQKWLEKRPNLAVGDYVLLVDENCPRGRWLKGVIQEVFPDRHGVVRHVTVKTATTSLRRDIRKCAFGTGTNELSVVTLYFSERLTISSCAPFGAGVLLHIFRCLINSFLWLFVKKKSRRWPQKGVFNTYPHYACFDMYI